MSIAIREFTPDQVDLIKRTICKGASDDQLQLFMYACKRTGLDPFTRQIYGIPSGGRLLIVTGIDGYRLVAERTGRYSPGREPTFVYDKDGKLISATAYIKKRTDDGMWHEICASSYWEEFNGTTPNWKKMPHHMLAKCAEALAIRRAFPSELSDVYTKEELDQAAKEESPKEDQITPAQLSQLRWAMNLIPNGRGEKIRKGIENKYKSLENLTQVQFVSAMDFVKKAHEEIQVEEKTVEVVTAEEAPQ